MTKALHTESALRYSSSLSKVV